MCVCVCRHINKSMNTVHMHQERYKYKSTRSPIYSSLVDMKHPYYILNISI